MKKLLILISMFFFAFSQIEMEGSMKINRVLCIPNSNDMEINTTVSLNGDIALLPFYNFTYIKAFLINLDDEAQTKTELTFIKAVRDQRIAGSDYNVSFLGHDLPERFNITVDVDGFEEGKYILKEPINVDGFYWCKTCSENKGECKECKTGYFFLNEETVCTKCTDYLEGCIDCISDGECRACRNGYKLNGMYCYNETVSENGTIQDGTQNKPTDSSIETDPKSSEEINEPEPEGTEAIPDPVSSEEGKNQTDIHTDKNDTDVTEQEATQSKTEQEIIDGPSTSGEEGKNKTEEGKEPTQSGTSSPDEKEKNIGGEIFGFAKPKAEDGKIIFDAVIIFETSFLKENTLFLQFRNDNLKNVVITVNAKCSIKEDYYPSNSKDSAALVNCEIPDESGELAKEVDSGTYKLILLEAKTEDGYYLNARHPIYQESTCLSSDSPESGDDIGHQTVEDKGHSWSKNDTEPSQSATSSPIIPPPYNPTPSEEAEIREERTRHASGFPIGFTKPKVKENKVIFSAGFVFLTKFYYGQMIIVIFKTKRLRGLSGTAEAKCINNAEDYDPSKTSEPISLDCEFPDDDKGLAKEIEDGTFNMEYQGAVSSTYSPLEIKTMPEQEIPKLNNESPSTIEEIKEEYNNSPIKTLLDSRINIEITTNCACEDEVYTFNINREIPELSKITVKVSLDYRSVTEAECEIKGMVITCPIKNFENKYPVISIAPMTIGGKYYVFNTDEEMVCNIDNCIHKEKTGPEEYPTESTTPSEPSEPTSYPAIPSYNPTKSQEEKIKKQRSKNVSGAPFGFTYPIISNNKAYFTGTFVFYTIFYKDQVIMIQFMKGNRRRLQNDISAKCTNKGADYIPSDNSGLAQLDCEIENMDDQLKSQIEQNNLNLIYKGATSEDGTQLDIESFNTQNTILLNSQNPSSVSDLLSQYQGSELQIILNSMTKVQTTEYCWCDKDSFTFVLDQEISGTNGVTLKISIDEDSVISVNCALNGKEMTCPISKFSNQYPVISTTPFEVNGKYYVIIEDEELSCNIEQCVDKKKEKDDGLSTGAIVGIIAGGVVLIAIIITVGVLLCKKKKRKHSTFPADSEQQIE